MNKHLLAHGVVAWLALAGMAACAAPPVEPGDGPDRRRHELRSAVEAHRTAQRDEVSRVEAAAGRRLTPAERVELREQLRRHWAPHGEVSQTAESQPAERLPPGSMPPGSLLPRSTRQ